MSKNSSDALSEEMQDVSTKESNGALSNGTATKPAAEGTPPETGDDAQNGSNAEDTKSAEQTVPDSALLGGAGGALGKAMTERLGRPGSKYTVRRGVTEGPPSMYIEGQSEEDLKKAFEALDVSRSGRLERDEVLTALLPSIGVHDMTPEEYESLMAMVDSDNDGTIDFIEFVELYRLLCMAGDGDESAGPPKTGKQLVDNIKESKRKAEEQYLTEKQIAGKQRIAKILYDIPCFAPDYVYRRWWDLVVLINITCSMIIPSVVCALAVCGLTYIPSFVHAARTTMLEPTSGRIAVDLVIMVVNIFDILIILNTGFQPEGSFVLQVKRRDILRNYARHGLLPVDIIAAVPIDLMVWAGTKSITAYRVFTLLRAVKLAKIPKLFHMTNRGTMDPSFVRFYFLTVPVINWLFKMIFVAHFLTLTRMIISQNESYSSSEEECPLYGRDGCTRDPFLMYFYSFFWVWSLLTTQGTAHLESFISFFYATCVMFLSLLLQGVVVANMSAIILKSNVEVQNQDAMRGTLAIMRHYRIPELLQQEVLSFQFHSLQQNAAASLAHTLERLPPTMQREVGLYVKVDLVTNVPMFQELMTEAQLSLANCLEQAFAEPYDYIIAFGEQGSSMYFMMHGFADVIIPAPAGTEGDGQTMLGSGSDMCGRVVATIIRGDFFGEVALLKPELKRTASIQALTYCNLYRLGLEQVMELFKQYPEIKVRMETEARSRGLLSKDDDASNDRKASVASIVETVFDNGNTLTSAHPLGVSEIRKASVVSVPKSSPPVQVPLGAKATASGGSNANGAAPTTSGELVNKGNSSGPATSTELPGQTGGVGGEGSSKTIGPTRSSTSLASSSKCSGAEGITQVVSPKQPNSPVPRPGLPKTRSFGNAAPPPPAAQGVMSSDRLVEQSSRLAPQPSGAIFTIGKDGPQANVGDKREWFGFGGGARQQKAGDAPQGQVAAVGAPQQLPPPAPVVGGAPQADPEQVKKTVTSLLKALEGNNERILRGVHKDMVQYARRVDDIENKLCEAMSKLTQLSTLQSAGNFPRLPGDGVAGGARAGHRGSVASMSHEMYAPQAVGDVRRTSLRWL